MCCVRARNSGWSWCGGKVISSTTSRNLFTHFALRAYTVLAMSAATHEQIEHGGDESLHSQALPTPCSRCQRFHTGPSSFGVPAVPGLSVRNPNKRGGVRKRSRSFNSWQRPLGGGDPLRSHGKSCLRPQQRTQPGNLLQIKDGKIRSVFVLPVILRPSLLLVSQWSTPHGVAPSLFLSLHR